MKFTLGFVCIVFLKVIASHDSESSEMNRIEISPFYDAIIISDIADIINEFDNNANAPIDAFINSESESDENIEDLLNEYQIYLDKAHKQHLDYLESKTKGKNKVPLVRHEKYIKGKTANVKHDNYFFSGFLNPNSIKFPQPPQNNAFNIFIPLTPNDKFKTGDISKDSTPQLSVYDKLLKNKLLPINLPPTVVNPELEIKTHCFCKNGQFNCKQCTRADSKLMVFDKTLSEVQQDPARLSNNLVNGDGSNNFQENTINLRVKVDVQVPSLMNMNQYYKGRYHERMMVPEDTFSKEYMSSINLPIPYFNFPIPIDALTHRKSPKYFRRDNNIHEITIHKKKKSRNNNNKKHRNKIISFSHSKISPTFSHINTSTVENVTNFGDHQGVYSTSERNKQINISNIIIEGNSISINNSNKEQSSKEKVTGNDTQIEESIFVTLNISNVTDKDDSHKIIENSIEPEYNTKIYMFNVTTERALRRKRDTSHQNITVSTNLTVAESPNLTNLIDSAKVVQQNETKVKEQISPKRMEKSMLADAEMLFWPNTPQNRSVIHPSNITTIILDRENKKTKLNMSIETIRHNRTVALEQAIFGNVDWDDVDAVAPTFLSFVGKYIKGALTFCSEKICHSMKCEDKKCSHRTCIPEDRFNQKGHCTGSNTTDSTASLESIMDLPSSVVFKIVDILEDKLIGKIFGKVTLCINAKCMTFLASKKVFLKYRCNIKEANTTGHCPNVKNAKMM